MSHPSKDKHSPTVGAEATETEGFTPSTDQVRAVYVVDGTRLTYEARGRDFDAWLDAHDAGVARAAAEKAWDEGRSSAVELVSTGYGYALKAVDGAPVNPYRCQEAEQHD